MGLKIFTFLAFLVMSGVLRAEFITLTSRTQGPNFTQFFTGDRYKVFAQIDTAQKLLRISAWEYGNPPEHLWHRDYPLTSQTELMAANRAMAHSELSYDLSSFVTLHEANCTALFFSVLSEETVELDRDVARIVTRLEGDSNDLAIHHLLTVNTQCYGPIKVGAVLNKQNEFVKFALVSGDRRVLSGMSIESQSGHFFIKKNGVPFVRILKENFSRTGGGNFSVHVSRDCSGQNFLQYNFSVGKIRKDGRDKWRLTSFTPADGVISLAMDRNPEIDVAEDIVEAPVELFLGLLDGIFGTLVWAFIPGDTKREMIYSRVLEQARANATLREHFTDQELQAMSHRIANNNSLRWFAPFTGQGRVKKAAYLEFSTALMKKIAAESLPAGSTAEDAERIMYVTTRDLQACLQAAGEQEEFDTCMAKFTRSGPYRLGRELLLAHLGKKLVSQNLTESERSAIINTAALEYNRCAQNEYFRRYDDHIKTAYSNRRNRQKTNLFNVADQFDGNAVIRSCLYSAMNEGAELALGTIVGKTVQDNLQNPQTRARISNGLKEQYKNCAKGHGFYRETQGYREYNYASLRRLETQDFETKISQCIDAVTVAAGRQVIDANLRENTSLVEATRTNPAQMELVIRTTMEQGLERCLATQTSPRPTDCLPLVEVVAAKEVMGLVMRDTVSKGLEGNPTEAQRILGMIGMAESANVQFNMNQCFQDRMTNLNERLAHGETLATDNAAILNCIKGAILVVAPAIGVAKYNASIADMPVIVGLDLNSSEMRTRVQTQVRSCFETGLSGIPNMAELSTGLTQITDNCTLSLYQELVPSIVQDVLRLKVAATFTDQYAQRRVLAALDRRFRAKVMAQADPTAIIELIDGFTLEATFFILEEALKESVHSNVPGDSRAFSDNLLTTILTPARREAITLAVNTKNDNQLKEVLGQIKKDAGIMILEHSIPLKIAEHVPQENLRSSITAQVGRNYKACLKKFRNTAADFDRKFASCNSTAMNEATISVFRTGLDLALEEHFPTQGQDSWTRQFNREKHQRVRAKLINAAFRREVAEINAGGGGFALTILSYQFKFNAGIEIARETFVFW
ncbi:MAG: hypothetical protein A2X86_10610 [Bdellovibrionales bacterium GWA2_49_15]|nr:MAG: hypothetical protein A2X86_10610 [Bdellovibrionales bacterium GWA2_49_15]HAZ11426.1 hypothetical protein [Bdellovibrionales bacterium]